MTEKLKKFQEISKELKLILDNKILDFKGLQGVSRFKKMLRDFKGFHKI